jgi:hypothetical protein
VENIRTYERGSADPGGRTVLRHWSTATCMLELQVQIPLRAWMSVCCECCVLSGRGLCRVDRLSRGVLPSVVCLSVITEPHRRGPGLLGLSSHENKDMRVKVAGEW